MDEIHDRWKTSNMYANQRRKLVRSTCQHRSVALPPSYLPNPNLKNSCTLATKAIGICQVMCQVDGHVSSVEGGVV
ncbi:hypothetical protein ACFXTO_044908 [Malus domestica]